MLKIGNKVRNIHDNTEGNLVYSSSGASISGFYWNEELNSWVHFQTLGDSINTYEKDWKRIYKWKYNMKEYEELKVKED